jgi:hypothetical protein
MTSPPEATARAGGIDRLAAWIIGAACLVSLATFLLPGIDIAIARHFPDDALFYNLVARNLLAGHGSTCDGLTRSNGYHPLWMVVVTGVEWLMGSKAMLGELALMLVMNATAGWLLYTWLRSVCRAQIALSLALLATFEQSVFQVTWSGMETTLAWLALIALLVALRRGPLETLPRRRVWEIGMGLLGLMMARLDGGLFWIAIAFTSLLGASLSPPAVAARLRVLLRLFLPSGLVVLAYLAFNQWWFGTAMPISGRIKSIAPWQLISSEYDWAHAWIRLRRILVVDPIERAQSMAHSVAPGTDLLIALLWLGFLAAALAWVVKSRAGDFSLRCLVLYAGLHTAYYTLLQSDPYSLAWARGPELLLMITLVGCVIERASGSRLAPGRAVPAACLVVVIVFGATSHVRRLTPKDRIYDFDVARADFSAAVDYLGHALAPDEPVITWNIGFLGYYTRRPVVSYDGLLNSREYFEEYLSRRRVADYMRSRHIRYIANRIPAAGDPATLLAGQFAGLQPSDVEVLALFDRGVTQGIAQNRYVVARCNW